ncbi:hypothetical protein OSTOST_07838, partial [Ostertagia ostertagi]
MATMAKHCKCRYIADKGVISWTVRITLEAYKNDQYQEESFYVHDVSGKETLQLILRNLVVFVSARQRSLADEFMKKTKHGVVRDVETFIVTPTVEVNKVTQL